jgi:hypothetical protein
MFGFGIRSNEHRGGTFGDLPLKRVASRLWQDASGILLVPGGTKLLSGREDGGWLTASLGCSFETDQNDTKTTMLRGKDWGRRCGGPDSNGSRTGRSVFRAAKWQQHMRGLNSRALLSELIAPLSFHTYWNYNTACGDMDSSHIERNSTTSSSVPIRTLTRWCHVVELRCTPTGVR